MRDKMLALHTGFDADPATRAARRKSRMAQ
jgi:hypothetical protein